MLRWLYRYGAALDILHLLDSSAASDACPLPHPNEAFPSTEVASSIAVSYIACAHTHGCPVSHVGRSLAIALASLLIHVVECCSALRVCRRYLRGHGCWLVIVSRHSRSLEATFQLRPGVDTNSKAGGATHGRFRAWQALRHFGLGGRQRQELKADDEQTLRPTTVSFHSCARLRLHTDNPFRQILT